ncbi:hypothetical protein [Limnospira platensis]|uniref:hypothetical protein n=1 Tax=Limnospira platensis TaxID=118562 RepID=UPI00190F78CC|nr:hypothetical protein AP9108_34765 [Arthrospira sp. PCC 9108]
MSAAHQLISLPNHYDGSSQTFGSRLIIDGWQWSESWEWVPPHALRSPLQSDGS